MNTSEAWIISHIRHDITHQWGGSGGALVSVLVSWVTWWHFSPQSQRLDDIRWPRENRTGEKWEIVCRDRHSPEPQREYKLNGINRGKCFRCRVTNFFRNYHPIMYCVGVTRHRGTETIRMLDDGDRAETGQGWRVETASRKTGCPSPGHNEYFVKSQNDKILLQLSRAQTWSSLVQLGHVNSELCIHGQGSLISNNTKATATLHNALILYLTHRMTHRSILLRK